MRPMENDIMLLAFLKNLLLIFSAPSGYQYRSITPVDTTTDVPSPIQFEYECSQEGWCWGDLDHDVKIDTSGHVYFKIKQRWVLQPTLSAIYFIRE